MTTADTSPRRGRRPTGYTHQLPQHIAVREEVAQAIAHLSQMTGMSGAAVVREALERHLGELGLITPEALTPTAYRRKENP